MADYFRMSFMIEDKYVTDILRQLSGRARDMQVVPVVNVVGKPNGVMRQSAEHSVGLFCKELKKLEAINPTTAREAAQKAGLSPTSYLHMLRQAMKAGLIKKSGKGSGVKYAWA